MTHIPQDIPVRGWTPGHKARFLDRLAVHGNVREACRCVGLSAEAAYRLRRRDAMFARGWAAALVLARQNCEQVLGERAVEGVEEEIFYRGELVGTRRRYDSRLLLAHLARLDRLVDEDGAGSDAGRFDEILASVADPRTELAPRPDRASKAAAAPKPSPEQLLLEDYLAFLEEIGMTPQAADSFGEDRAFLGMLEEEGFEHMSLAEMEELEKAEEAKEPEPALGAREERLRSVYGAVDRLCRKPEHVLSKRWGAPAFTPPRAAPETLGRVAEGFAAQTAPARSRHNARSGRGFSFPRTVSTVSTCTLATALVAGLGGAPSRSPFTAPRMLQAGRPAG